MAEKDSIDAILLTGSFGRNEATIHVQDGTFRILNDIDVLVITESDIRKCVATSTEILMARLGVDFVDIATCNRSSLSEPGYTMHKYDLKYGASVVYGDTNILELIPAFDPKLFPLVEGVELLLNRYAGYLGMQFVEFSTAKSQFFEKIQVMKLLIAMGDFWLIAKEEYYDSSYESRLKKFSTVQFPLKDLYFAISDAYLAKLNWQEPERSRMCVETIQLEMYLYEYLSYFDKAMLEGHIDRKFLTFKTLLKEIFKLRLLSSNKSFMGTFRTYRLLLDHLYSDPQRSDTQNKLSLYKMWERECH